MPMERCENHPDRAARYTVRGLDGLHQLCGMCAAEWFEDDEDGEEA